MNRTLTAVAIVACAALTACSSNSGSSSTAAKPKATASGSGFQAARYLYGLDGDKHSRHQIDALLAKLREHCSDDLGVLAMAATNTAVNVTDAKGTQTTYGVLEKLAAGQPSSGRSSCKDRLPAVEKQLKASH